MNFSKFDFENSRAEADAIEAIKLHLDGEVRSAQIETMRQGLTCTRLRMALWSFSTARYEDVKKDIQRGRLTFCQVHNLLRQMVDARIITDAHATIWRGRMA